MNREFYSKKFWRQWSYSVYPYSSHILRVVSWILTMPTYLHRVKNKITHTVINKILHIAYLLEWQALMEMFSYSISHLLFFSQTFWATKLIPMIFFLKFLRSQNEDEKWFSLNEKSNSHQKPHHMRCYLEIINHNFYSTCSLQYIIPRYLIFIYNSIQCIWLTVAIHMLLGGY